MLTGVEPNSCPAALNTRSGQFTLDALTILRMDPLLAFQPSELKRLTFGERGSEGFRTPNGEVEVLLGLWNGRMMDRD
jgi:hypothetical protein